MKTVFLIVSIIYLGIGCQSDACQTVIMEEAKKEFMLLPDSIPDKFSSLCSFYTNDGKSWFALYDNGRRSVLFFDENGKQHSRVTLEFPDSLSADVVPFVKPLSFDSILALWPAMRSVYLYNENGKIIKQFDATTALNDKQENYSLVAMNLSPVNYDGKNIFVTCTRLDVVVRSKEARKIYFSTPPDIRMNLLKPEEQKNTGTWPAEYRSGASFRDFYPQRCVNGSGEIIYAFSASDSIYILKNDKVVSRHLCKSKFVKQRHAYPDDSVGHFSYLERYEVTEPRNISIIYDPYRKYYYRIVAHGIEFEKEDGMTVNTIFDKPWSLIIMDKNFKILDEIIFDNKKFLPVAFPAADGLLIRKRQEKVIAFPIAFSLFKFSK